MTTYETRITRLTVAPRGEATFSEQATHIEIDDEAAGEFVSVSQDRCNGKQCFLIDPEEWPALRDAIDRMVKECRPDVHD